jgi:putative ABC transport system ATP-binding protein
MFRRWFRRNGLKNATNKDHYHPNSKTLIDLRQIVKIYESTAGTFTALKGVDLQVSPGEFVAVVGKSGSGKSTLINMIAGIDRPSSGEVLVGDTAVHTLTESQIAKWRGRRLGVVFQFFQLLPTLTVIENIMLPMDFCQMYSPGERQERAMQLLEQVEMADQAHKLPTAISGGQQQRVAIARALANDPPVILADEPTGNLDSQTAASVFQLFEHLVSQGKTILMVTHDHDLTKRVTRAITVADGQIVAERRSDDLEKQGSERKNSFLLSQESSRTYGTPP